MIGAVVPIKALHCAKSRLLAWLDADVVEQLSIAMLRDLLETLQRVGALARIGVATPDPRVAAIAREAGAQWLDDSDAALNASIEAACAAIAPRACDAALVVLGDVAGAQPRDITALLEALPERGVALAASSDGGTSALLRRPRGVIPARFGADSARAHRELARAARVECRELALASLAIDVDARGDLEQLAVSGFAGEHTRALLRELLPERGA